MGVALRDFDVGKWRYRARFDDSLVAMGLDYRRALAVFALVAYGLVGLVVRFVTPWVSGSAS